MWNLAKKYDVWPIQNGFGPLGIKVILINIAKAISFYLFIKPILLDCIH